jgi:hypothetical protein
MVTRPRATLAELIARPAWVAPWLLILIVWAVCGGWLLSTEIGQQALVDERVRVIETFGGEVEDDEYAALQAHLPWWVYLTSGGRALLAPPATVLAAVSLWLVARGDGAVATTMRHALAIAIHASVVLLIGQLIATPLHYLRESLTSPLNMAAVLPLMEEGTLPARFFGTLDIFAMWWAWLLALGLSALTRRPVRRYAWPLAAAYIGFAAIVAALIAATGGA